MLLLVAAVRALLETILQVIRLRVQEVREDPQPSRVLVKLWLAVVAVLVLVLALVVQAAVEQEAIRLWVRLVRRTPAAVAEELEVTMVLALPAALESLS
jgi:hypothetical protein